MDARIPDSEKRGRPGLSVIARACAVGLFSIAALGAHAQSTFPNKPVSLVTAFPAGSGPDAVLRQVADKLSREWQQPVTVVNRPGGGGFIAIDSVRRLPPDGYTLLQLDSEHLAALPLLYKSKDFVTLDQFDPVAPMYRTPFLVAVPTESRWRSVGDLVAAAKADPGKINFGSWGVGSPGHLGGEEMQLLTQTEMTHVAFREMTQLFSSVATGDVHWSFGSIPSSQGMYKAGKIRYLAVAASKRITQMPDVPTMVEAGGPPGLEVNSFVSLVAPKGIPQAIAAKIHADVLQAEAEPDVRKRFDTFAFEPLTWSAAEIRRNADAKYKVYEQLVKRKNISLD
ncbi:MAG: tripartite tricarboxylate transporter substrate binding protein [Ramlibacter sp.]